MLIKGTIPFCHIDTAHIYVFDMFLTDKWLLQQVQVEYTKIHDITWSDHAAISMSVHEKGVSSSPPNWRCNVRLLQEPKTHTKISQHLKNFFLDNKESVKDPYILWNSHKAQLWAREKRKHTQKRTKLLNEILDTETLNKNSPTSNLTHKLTTLKQSLREHLYQQYDKHLRCLQLNYYVNANRAGKYLANRLKAVHTKSRRDYLKHHTSHHKFINHQDIANQFADYYSSLYNLHNDPTTSQPTKEKIQSFL